MTIRSKIKLLIAMVIAWMLAASVCYGHEATVENVEGNIRFYIEEGGARVKRDTGTDLYFQNPLNAMADALNRAQVSGKACVVRERQETCVEVSEVETDDGTGEEGTGGDGTDDTGDTEGDGTDDTGDTGGDGTDDTGDTGGGDTETGGGDEGDGADQGDGDDGTGDTDTDTGGGTDIGGAGSGGDELPANYQTALYAYFLDPEGSLKDPQPLEGALLTRGVIHFGWGGMDAVRFYCCKGEGAPHRPVYGGTVYTIDLNELPVGAGPRELYSDFILDDGSLKQGNAVNFRVVDPELVEVTLEWTIPNERENGDHLPVEQLAGYRIEYQPTDADGVPFAEPVEGGAQDFYDMDLPPGLYSFRVTAIDTGGLESDPSDWVEGNLTITEEGDRLVTLNW